MMTRILIAGVGLVEIEAWIAQSTTTRTSGVVVALAE